MKKDVALVLSGGGARGIAHIGVIEALEEQGFNITSISGTSMGSLVGAVYAIGKLQEFKQWLLHIDKLEIFKLVDFTFGSQGFIKGDRIFSELKKFIPDVNIEELTIDYTAVATDIMNKREVVFTQGSIFDAVRASVSIPSVFTPVKTPSTMLIDGGTINNLPLDRVKRKEDDLLIAVDVVANVPFYETEKDEEKYQQKIKKFRNYFDEIKARKISAQLSYFEIIDKSINLMIEEVVKLKLKTTPPDLLIQVSQDVCTLFDFYKAEKIIAYGREVAEDAIAVFMEEREQ
ncbi:MAG: patatin-like phospholipase family protein [Flavobacteriales bacterium]|jgi:NTE family protein|nr:patatin-like phospholipase family protein [Flavobacteriales bacterium]